VIAACSTFAKLTAVLFYCNGLWRCVNVSTASFVHALCRAKQQTSRRLNSDYVAKSVDSSVTAVSRKLRDTTTRTRSAARRPVDVESSRTYNVDSGVSTPSCPSTPRTYIVDVLADTDNESNRQASPRTADRLSERRRPQSFDNGQLPTSTLAKDGGPDQSTSTETFVYPKAGGDVSSSESPRRRRRRPTTTSPTGAVAAVVVSSTPNLPKVIRRPRRRRSSASSEGEVMIPSRAQPVMEAQVPSHEDTDDVVSKTGVPDHPRVSRLPRLVTQPQDTLPNTSCVSATLLRGPRPRSFRYSRLHRRAIDALVPQALREMPWRWALKANAELA